MPRWPEGSRVLERIDDFISPEPMSGCWLWLGSTSGSGYPKIHVWDSIAKRNAGSIYIHRLMNEKFIGNIPDGLDLDHLCRNRCCVNPTHLEPVTRAENLRRGIGPELTRQRKARQTHCLRGHPLSGSNVYKLGNRRHCRECHNLRHRKENKNARRS